jgi:hypothetical protein
MYSTMTLQDTPATPSPLPQAAHTSTSKLQKRSSAGRPLTSASNLRGGTRTLTSTPEATLNDESARGGAVHPFPPFSNSTLGQGPFTFEVKNSENTPPNWLRRISTLSSLKTGSPEPTLRPGSPSFSYSNGSTVPILPDFADLTSSTTSRNKLVKRSSSQRLLSSGNALHSSLRRPATSHQRSANLQQFQQNEEPGRLSLAASSIMPSESVRGTQSYDDLSQVWVPSFKPRVIRTARDGFARRASANGIPNTRNEAIETIVPGMTEKATLVMATSISLDSSHEIANRRPSNISVLSRPFSPIGFEASSSSRGDKTNTMANATPELKSRGSFSLSEMFPSPSPSTWKMPRAGSLRKSKPFTRDTGGRRVVSDPQSSNPHKPIRSAQTQSNLERNSVSRNDTDYEATPSVPGAIITNNHQRGSSSPLPPLNRLSAFEINLPEAMPSYPTSPQPESPAPFQRELSTSPFSPFVPKVRQHRFSSGPSEPGSTLLGSDNDNSRLMSGDEDDMDARSETVYDSTRTGATGSSHSGIRRPPIDTIFDESPPPELPPREKLLDLQDLLHHNDSFTGPNTTIHHIVAAEQQGSTPVPATVPCKEDDSSTPMHKTEETFLASEASPPSVSALTELKTTDPTARKSQPDQDEDLWSFEHAEISHAEAVHIRNVSLNGSNHPLIVASQHSEADRRRESPPARIPDKSSKTNIFEWSESPLTDRESSHGESPRPKTVHGKQGRAMRGNQVNGRRGPSALHLRSQSVPVQKDITGRRTHNNPSTLDSWVLGNKGPSEDWDGDFEFEEGPRTGKQASNSDPVRPSFSSGMLVPRNILERQASVHGQFGQVKELALLVEDLRRLQQQAAGQGIMEGQSAELWKEAEGIINLATLDDEEQEIFPPRSPHSPSFDFDPFDEDSPSLRSRRRSGMSPPTEGRLSMVDDSPASQPSSRPPQDMASMETPPPSRPRNESSAKAKSVLENIHQQRSPYDAVLLDAPFAQKKLPFDTTSLKDLVTRAGVVTRALKEIVRRAENGPKSMDTPEPRSSTPRDPPYISQMFHQPPISPTRNKSPRVTQSPKSPQSQKSGTFKGGGGIGNDNESNGHMKLMTVV